MSIFYFKARVLSYDSAWHLFSVIQDETFLLDHNRYLMVAIQWLPLMLVKMGASLKAVMLSYSIAWVLFPYSIYLLLVYGFKTYKAALLLVLALILNPGVSFFYVAAELPLSLSVFALFVGWLSFVEARPKLSKYLGFTVAILLIGIASYGRLLIGGVILAYLVFVGLDEQKWKDRFWQGLVAFTLLWFVLRVMLIPADSYEGGAIRNMAQIFDWGTYFSRPNYLLPWFRTISKSLWPNYLISLVLISYYLLSKRLLLALYTLGVLLGFSLICIWYSPNGALGTDHYLMMWGAMIALPLLNELAQIKHKTWPGALLLCLCLICLNNCYQLRRHFVKRVAYLEFVLAQNAQRQSAKTISTREDLDHNYFWVDWSLGVETLLLSSMSSPDNSQTVFAEIPSQTPKLKAAMTQSDLWLGPHFNAPLPSSALNASYFRLPKQAYQKLKPPPFQPE
ncbi:MAG: hypothetical protein AAFN10_21785 [Bacteroidota bacterium]